MKELTIEEKAKAYDKALEDAKYYHSRMGDDVKCVLEEVFSELRESEDESEDDKIRRALLNTVKYYHFKESPYMLGISKEQVIAWLEKQRREKDSVVDFKAKDWYVSKVDGKIHNMCYSVDKVEPRFKIGDWVVFNNKFHDSIYQIENIENYVYTLRHFLGGSMPLAFDKEDMIRHWNIQDAKDGDVLSDGTTIFTFKDLLPDGSVMSYCDYDKDSGESDAFCPLSMNLMCSKITPATKEQRDALMKAMADAGYTFDFDKKELTKIENEIEIPFGAKDSELQEVTYYIPEGFHAEIEGNNVVIKKGEQNSAWSEEDERNIKELLYVVEANYLTSEEPHDRLINFLESLKERVQPKQEWKQENTDDLTDFENAMMHIGDSFFGQHAGLDSNDTNVIKEQANLLLELVPSKEWSEEDIRNIENIDSVLFYDKNFPEDTCVRLRNWLKSLRPQNRWKPSEKQMELLKEACDEHWEPDGLDPLYTLYQDLKKLKGE